MRDDDGTYDDIWDVSNGVNGGFHKSEWYGFGLKHKVFATNLWSQEEGHYVNEPLDLGGEYNPSLNIHRRQFWEVID